MKSSFLPSAREYRPDSTRGAPCPADGSAALRHHVRREQMQPVPRGDNDILGVERLLRPACHEIVHFFG